MQIPTVFYHGTPIILTLTALLLSLLTLLSPTPIFHTEVSLFFLKPLPEGAKSGIASLTTRFYDDDYVMGEMPGRLMSMERRRVMELAATADDAKSQPGLWIGMLGSCSRPAGATLECTDPVMLPSFDESYNRLSLSAKEQSVLPLDLPLYPSSLVVSIVFGFVSWFLLIAASAPFFLAGSSNKIISNILAQHRSLAKLACLFGVTSLGVGIISTVSLRIRLGNAAVAFNVVGGSSGLQANLGSAFNQLWASWIILGMACLVAISLAARDNIALTKA